MTNDITEHIKCLSEYDHTLFKIICEYLNIKLEDLLGQRRKRKFVNGRKIASYILYNKGYTYEDIGYLISIKPKDHTSIMHYLKKVNEHYNLELEFKNSVISIKNILFNLEKQKQKQNKNGIKDFK
jgi:chromosomal replication initiation ATPase DnaA